MVASSTVCQPPPRRLAAMSSPAPATVMASPASPRPAATAPPIPAKSVRGLRGLQPFLRPYAGRIALGVVFLVMAAVSTLVFPIALKSLIDQGFVAAEPGDRVMALREHFVALF